MNSRFNEEEKQCNLTIFSTVLFTHLHAWCLIFIFYITVIYCLSYCGVSVMFSVVQVLVIQGRFKPRATGPGWASWFEQTAFIESCSDVLFPSYNSFPSCGLLSVCLFLRCLQKNVVEAKLTVLNFRVLKCIFSDCI